MGGSITDAGVVAQLARRLEERGPREGDDVVRVPDVVVVGAKKPPRSSRCRMEAKEVMVVVVSYDVLGSRLDGVELMVGADADGVEGALVAWWRWQMRRHCHGSLGSW